METGQNTRELSRVGRLQQVPCGNLPGWQLCPGISGSFRLEWVAALPWNQWQLSRGMGGRLRLESVADFVWNTQLGHGYGRFLGVSGRSEVLI